MSTRMEKFGSLRKTMFLRILIILSVSGCSFYLDVNRLPSFLQGSLSDTATPTDLKRQCRLLILIVRKPSTLTFNTLTMAEPKLYKCGFCDEWSGQPEHATRAHLSWKHNICWSAAIPCTQKFGSRKELTKHWIQTNHCYYCYICDGGYQSKDLYANHACTPRKDAIIGGIKCPVCQMMARPRKPTTDTSKIQHKTQDTSAVLNATESSPRRMLSEWYVLQPPIHSSTANRSLLQHMQVHRPATISCSYCHENFCSHSDLFRHMEVACRFINGDIIYELLLALGPSKTCAIPLDLDAPQQYFCLECDRTFHDLGSLAAHMEHSRSCPADVKSKCFRKIIKAVNPPDIYQLESLSVWG
jgi:hypothetical protein